MRYLLKASGIAAAITFATFAPSVVAQETTFKSTCRDVGGFLSEPLGDREGHSISAGQYSCRVDSGPMSGGVDTGTVIYEWDKTSAVLVSGSGVVRKPGMTVVYQDVDGKLALTITDGKVTGWTASGRTRWPIGTGAAASLAGKSTTWTAKSTGPGQFEAEDKVE
jgi:hypothetical protein